MLLTQRSAVKGIDLNDAEPASLPIRPKLRCKRLDTPSAIDGNLAKPPWPQADVVSLRMFDGSAPSYRTLVRAMWDERNLYVAFDAEDPEPVGTMTQRDDPLFNDGNVVEMFVDPA